MLKMALLSLSCRSRGDCPMDANFGAKRWPSSKRAEDNSQQYITITSAVIQYDLIVNLVVAVLSSTTLSIFRARYTKYTIYLLNEKIIFLMLNDKYIHF